MAPLCVAYVLLLALTASVRALRPRAAPAPARERRSSIVLGAAHGLSLVAGIVFPATGIGALALGAPVAWTAVAVMALGFALQIWAMRTLGPLFTLQLQAADTQVVVERGPYRAVRHPGYLGQLAFWLAFAVAAENAIVLAVVAVASAVGYGLRIRTEERLLRATLGERYARYAARTARLIPGVW